MDGVSMRSHNPPLRVSMRATPVKAFCTVSCVASKESASTVSEKEISNSPLFMSRSACTRVGLVTSGMYCIARCACEVVIGLTMLPLMSRAKPDEIVR